MTRLSWSITIGLSLIFLPQSVFSQKTKAPVKNVSGKEKSEAKLEAERIRKEQQAEVRSLLVSLASDARSFRDQTLRARSPESRTHFGTSTPNREDHFSGRLGKRPRSFTGKTMSVLTFAMVPYLSSRRKLTPRHSQQ